MSQGSEVGGTESGDGVGGSPEVRRDLGMARNIIDWNVEQGLLLYHRIGLSIDPAHFAD